jgi:type III pantothenate kinase
MILAVDVGNTETVAGVFDGLTHLDTWRFSTDRTRTGDELGLAVQGSLGSVVAELDRIVVASVVPTLLRSWSGAASRLGLELLVLDGNSPLPIRLDVDRPGEVGSDRIANTLAAAELFSRDTIVVDLGTATTFDCITADGVFIGGVIAPGPTAGLEQLARATAQLPQVELIEPGRVVGRNTLECLQAGAFYSVVDSIDGIVRRILAEWGPADPLVVATGGLAEIVAPHCEMVGAIEPALTITGIAIAERYLTGGARG